jgi:hypothetical protein
VAGWLCPDRLCPDWLCPDWLCPDWLCPDWLGGAELGIKGEGLLPVAACPAEVAGGIVGVAEAVVGAGPLVLVTDLAAQAERRGVLGASTARIPGDEQDLTEAVERVGFTGLVADLPA